MFRNKSVSTHQFAMIPRADIPRSSFRMQHTHKTTFDAGYLIPVYIDEILPGDSFSVHMTAFARLATPLFPIMDNMHLDSFFFFVPTRTIWDNFVRMMGEQPNPGDSTSFTVPQVVSGAGGFVVGSIYDYAGLPTVGQVTAGQTVSVNVLPFRAMKKIYNDWFRDENLQNIFAVNLGDGPDSLASTVLFRRGKRHDYFTSCLPWPQKGAAVTLPLGTTAPVIPVTPAAAPTFAATGGTGRALTQTTGNTNVAWGSNADATGNVFWATTGLVTDLGAATAASINQMRQSFQIQRLLERDARGGTRYIESNLAHFGVRSPDARLQRAEYLGGGTTPIAINPIAQTSATGVTGGATPVATLAAIGTAVAQHGFQQSFTEHGYVIGFVSVRADLSYQQGLRKMWSRLTRYDHYVPALAHLGEQAVLNKEIYCVGGAPGGQDDGVFGYQERWAEYRYHPSKITGLFRSTSAGTIDPWHLAQRFSALPALNSTFIQDTPPVDRIVAVGASANGKQFLFDSFFDVKSARPMPLYSVPGLIDHF